MGNAIELCTHPDPTLVGDRPPLERFTDLAMAIPIPSVEPDASEGEDPWDWTVQQVIDAACYQKSSLLDGRSTTELILTNPQAFEQKLRENNVKGLAFLKDVDHASLRGDLCMTSLGDRSSVLHLIQILRRKSQKYIADLHAIEAMRPVISYDRPSSMSRVQGLGSPFMSVPGQFHTAAGSGRHLNNQDSPTTAFSRINNWVHESHQHLRESSLGQSSPEKRSSTLYNEAPMLPTPKPSSPRLPDVPLFPEPSAEVKADEQSVDPFSNIEDDKIVRSSVSDLDASTVSNQDPLDEDSDLTRPEQRNGERFVIDETGKKRRRLGLVTPEPPTESSMNKDLQNDGVTSAQHSSSDDQQAAGIPSKGAARDMTDEIPELSAANRRHRNGPICSAVDVKVDLPSSITPVEECAAGVVMIDNQGRKRLKPLLISVTEHADSQPASAPSASAFPTMIVRPADEPQAVVTSRTNGRPQNLRSSEDAYLGTKAFYADELFYGDTAIGNEVRHNVQFNKPASAIAEVDDSESFTLVSDSKISNGQRLYVNRLLQRYLRIAKPTRFRNKGREVTGVIPYSESLVRKHQPLSMTLFQRSSNGYTATRANRSAWRRIDQNPLVNNDDDLNNFELPEMSLAQQVDDPLDPDNLEKWKYLEGKDDVLPIYGDSGSEGEYDLDTWREMELEQGDIERPFARASKHKHLSDAQINNVIDTAIKGFSDEWQAKKSPKLERKGWRLWHRSRRDGSKEECSGALAAKMQYLETRLQSIRKEILRETWSREQQVLRQTKSMQQTVFDREEAKWLMRTLNSNVAPSKPAALPKTLKPKKIKGNCQPLNEGEEDIGSEDLESYCSSDEMDDFIVDDVTEGTPLGHDALLLDEGNGKTLEHLTAYGRDVDSGIKDSSAIADDSTLAEGLTKNPLFKRERSMIGTSKQGPEAKSDTAYIDLTELSDPVEPGGSMANEQADTKPPFRTGTPSLGNVEDTNSSFRRLRREPVVFKTPPSGTEIINLESDSEPSGATEKTPAMRTRLPGLNEIEKISRLDIAELVERQDRKRVLIWIVARSKKETRQGALKVLDQTSAENMKPIIWKGLSVLKANRRKIRNLEPWESDACLLIASWYVSWTIPVEMNQMGGIQTTHLNTTMEDEEGFNDFYEFLKNCLNNYKPQPKIEALSQTSAKTNQAKRTLLNAPGSSSQDTPNKTRVYAIPESQVAKTLQFSAQQRLLEQNRRKDLLKGKFKAMRVNDENATNVIVNVGKDDDHDFIYLNPKIGQRIQEHQKEGVRFMWRELTAEHDDLQGCLLAHTMGLGKTMQVITLLVTLAEASKSSNGNISNQVPLPLKKSQTLVLCPPTLLENWYEEFLMWAPDPFSDNIGDIRKVSSAMKLAERNHEIDEWRKGGGVLILGYQIFRDLIMNGQKSSGRPSLNGQKEKIRLLTESEHEHMKETLLEMPNLIVADEAHSFKGLTSELNSVMKLIKSKSRIALTGSPLSNNLDEYYAVIDWIAPNYLGNHIQFKAHYVEPIEYGIYRESTPAAYLESRKRLKALQLNLEPKVHRADITVLKEKLEGKVEFLIRMPLTSLQSEVYESYVAYMLGAVKTEETNVSTTTLWTWLQDLRVLCNHPMLFAQKIRKRLVKPTQQTSQKGGKKKKNVAQTEALDSDEEAVDPNVPSALTRKLLSIYNTLTTPLEALTLSYKMLVFQQILDLAEKAGDKTLVCSHSIATLDYIATRLSMASKEYTRIDGSVPTTKRQDLTRQFNLSDSNNVCLISTKAGGLGLNIYGANRVILMDSSFNPMHEEQAIGRSYRIGQRKTVFVYRLVLGGTFEEGLINQAIFKQQLATRVVDKKNPRRYALKGTKQYLFKPKPLEQQDFKECAGKDPLILDKLLIENEANIRSIALTETFHEEDNVKLSEAELKEVHQLRKELELQRRDPAAYELLKRQQVQNANGPPQPHHPVNSMGAGKALPGQLSQSLPQAPNAHNMNFEDWRLAHRAGVAAPMVSRQSNGDPIPNRQQTNGSLSLPPSSSNQNSAPITDAGQEKQIKVIRAAQAGISHLDALLADLRSRLAEELAENGPGAGAAGYEHEIALAEKGLYPRQANVAPGTRTIVSATRENDNATPTRTGNPASKDMGKPSTPSKKIAKAPALTSPDTPTKTRPDDRGPNPSLVRPSIPPLSPSRTPSHGREANGELPATKKDGKQGPVSTFKNLSTDAANLKRKRSKKDIGLARENSFASRYEGLNLAFVSGSSKGK